MSKDPAFLFYTSDFLTGTLFMNNEQVGIYIRLLCAQHQHGGLIDKQSFCALVGENLLVKNKFIETEDGFFNPRLMQEMTKRAKKSTSLSNNAKKGWEKRCKSNANASDLHMPIEDENEDVIVDKKEIVIIKDIISDLNTVLGTKYKDNSASNRALIKARLNEGHDLEDFKKVHRKMLINWGADPKMCKFLRPQTLYSNKFESYLNQKEVTTKLSQSGMQAFIVGQEWLKGGMSE